MCQTGIRSKEVRKFALTNARKLVWVESKRENETVDRREKAVNGTLFTIVREIRQYCI